VFGVFLEESLEPVELVHLRGEQTQRSAFRLGLADQAHAFLEIVALEGLALDECRRDALAPENVQKGMAHGGCPGAG